MRFRHDRTASATVAADCIVLEPALPSEIVRCGLRAVATGALLVVFGYCAWTAWGVLEGLGRVSLADMAQGLRVVSVRDAILCLVGYRVGWELVSALLQRRAGR